MSRSIRMFEVIQLLRVAQHPLTAQAIANELEVNKRTIYRDIAALQAMRIPIDGEAGIGYIMRRGYDLPPLMFTSAELEALKLGLALLGRTGDEALEKTAASVSRKIAGAVSDPEQTAVFDVPMFTSTWHDIPESGVNPQLLRDCIRDERTIEFSYRDKDNVDTRRTVRPLALLYYIEVVVLVAWCELRDDFRHFRLDRIKKCQPTDQPFFRSGERLRQLWRANHDLNPVLQ